MILLMSLSLLGIEVFQKSHAEYRIAKMEAQRLQAVTLADSGLEWAKAELALNPAWPGGEWLFAEGILTVTITSGTAEGGYWVTAEAVSGSAKRKLKALLIHDGDWKIFNYEVLNN